MKQLKPYSFWIICGVIILFEIGFLIFWGQADDAGNGPEAVKAILDKEFKNLEDLHNRANAGDPQGRFDPEVPLDIKNLTNKYLITERWKSVLVPIVQKYNQQLDQVRQDLIGRSTLLHNPITDNEDLSTWYTAYEGKSKEILLSLKNAGALAQGEESKEDLEENVMVRSTAGFYTKGANLPTAAEHPLLTTRCRIIEKIAEVVVATKGHLEASPVLDKHTPGIPDAAGAFISALEWKPHGKFDETDTGVVPIDLVLTLQGPTAALIATEGALEHVNTPVIVVQGATLAERSNWKPGERKAKSSEPMMLVINIEVLDYTLTHTGASAVQAAPTSGAGPSVHPAPLAPTSPGQTGPGPAGTTPAPTQPTGPASSSGPGAPRTGGPVPSGPGTIGPAAPGPNAGSNVPPEAGPGFRPPGAGGPPSAGGPPGAGGPPNNPPARVEGHQP